MITCVCIERILKNENKDDIYFYKLLTADINYDEKRNNPYFYFDDYKNNKIIIFILPINEDIYNDLFENFKKNFEYINNNNDYLFYDNNGDGDMKVLFKKICNKYIDKTKIIKQENKERKRKNTNDKEKYRCYHVYKITNIKTGEIYIGSSINYYKNRYNMHLNSLYNLNTKLANAILKYGENNFKHEIIKTYENITKEDLRKKENKYIIKYDTINNGYNNNLAYAGNIDNKKKKVLTLD